MVCSPSEGLPHHDNVETEFSGLGTSLHAIADGASLDEIPEEHRAAASEMGDLPIPDGAEQEVAFAYNVNTNTVRSISGRPYLDIEPFEIPMTVDVWGRGFVLDLKSGWMDLGPVRDNAQLLIAACANAAMFALDEVRIGIIDIRDPANPKLKDVTIDIFDLEAFRIKARDAWSKAELLRSAPVVAADVTEGGHCRYCPAILSCPAKGAMVLSMTDETQAPQQVELEWAGGLTEQNAPAAYEAWSKMKVLTKRMGEIIRAYAKYNPIDIGDGRVYGEHVTAGREKLDGAVVWHTIKRLHGIDVAEEACGFVATKSSIKKALQGANVKPVAPAERAILKEIRAQGGAEKKQSTKIEEHAV